MFPEIETVHVAIEKDAEAMLTFPKEIVEGKVIFIVPPLGIGSNVYIEKI
jgi:hypothetical protein